MTFKIQIVLIFLLGAFLIACANYKVNLIPKANDQIQVIATSSSSSDAIKGAGIKSEEYCADKGKSYVVIEENSEFQGQNKGEIERSVNVYLKGGNENDYKVTWLIECK